MHNLSQEQDDNPMFFERLIEYVDIMSGLNIELDVQSRLESTITSRPSNISVDLTSESSEENSQVDDSRC